MKTNVVDEIVAELLAGNLLEEALALAKNSSDAQFSIERPEYNGLLGRIRKQLFVQSDDVNHLVAATDQYLKQYSAKEQFWHGINIVALRTEEERRGLDPRGGQTTLEFAARVLDLALASHAKSTDDYWSLATASEACLALRAGGHGSEWCDQAELWLHRFLNHPATNPFSVESYSRQLREIWRGNPLGGASCADRLAGIIDRYVRRSERRWSVDPRKVQELRNHPEVLERNFSGERTFTVPVLRHMLALSPNVGDIDSTGARLGTGFLMPGGSHGFAEPLVFVTNAHVIRNTWKTSVRSTNAKVTFEIESAAAGAPVVHSVKRVLFTSEPGNIGELSPTLGKLDVTIVSLETLPKDVTGLKPAADVLVPRRTPRLSWSDTRRPAHCSSRCTTACCSTSVTTSGCCTTGRRPSGAARAPGVQRGLGGRGAPSRRLALRAIRRGLGLAS